MVDDFWDGSSDEMSFEVDTEGQVSGKDAVASAGAKSVHKEGRYHCMVKVVKKENPTEKDNPVDGECPFTSPSINLMLEVLNGDNPDQKGLAVFHRIYLWAWSEEKGKFVVRSGKQLKFIAQFAYGLGMISKDDLDSQKFKLNFSQEFLEGRQCVVEVRDEPYKDKDGNEKSSWRIPFGNCWRPDELCVKDVPKDAEAMAIYLAGTGSETPPNLF